MVFWICLAVVVVALGVLLVLVVELRAKQRRLEAAVEKAQQQTAPAIRIVGSLRDLKPPTLPAKSSRRTPAPITVTDP